MVHIVQVAVLRPVLVEVTVVRIAAVGIIVRLTTCGSARHTITTRVVTTVAGTAVVRFVVIRTPVVGTTSIITSSPGIVTQ